MRADYVKQYEALEGDHWWWRARRQMVLEKIARIWETRLKKNRFNLLDVGCGAGINLAAIKEKFGPSVLCIGVEPDPILAQRARVHSGAEIIEGALPDKLPDFNQQFDVILLLDVLEHIDDDMGALRTLKQVMAPSAVMIVNVPALSWLWSRHDLENSHKRRYERKSLESAAKRAGYRVADVRYWGHALVPMAFLSRVVLSRVGKQDATYRVAIPSAFMGGLMSKFVTYETKATTLIARRLWGLSLLAVLEPCR